jgi:hypothetical protein
MNLQKIVSIVAASDLGDYKLGLRFNDGATQVVEFKPFLQHSQHPDIQAYLDKKRFSEFRLEHGDLIWVDYDRCFPIMDLYTNQVDKCHLTQAKTWTQSRGQ